ncbi:unnamed protein product [Peniophora sp. CBMAI 1063]|nr:unnamed protein product [Peniophora sp. CBMAI 1063]
MAGNSAQDAIELSSSDDYMTDGVEDDSLSEGENVPSDSASDDDPLFPPVEPAQGSEDDKSSDEVDNDIASPADAAPRPSTPPASARAAPRMPDIPPRQPYVMNHNASSAPLRVNVPIPPPFSRVGLQNSEHFNQWLRHIRDSSVPAPPYSEHMSELHAAVGIQLGVTLQHEAANLLTWRVLLEGTESEILELDRLQFILARMASSPLMRAAAAVQGADLTLPQTLLDRAAAPAPTPGVIYGLDVNEREESPLSDVSLPGPSLTTNARKRTLIADLMPVSFDEPSEEPAGAASGGASRASAKSSKTLGRARSPPPAAGPSRLRPPSPPLNVAERAPTPGPSVSRSRHVRRRSDSHSPTQWKRNKKRRKRVHGDVSRA